MISQGVLGNLGVDPEHPPKLCAGLVPKMRSDPSLAKESAIPVPPRTCEGKAVLGGNAGNQKPRHKHGKQWRDS